MEKTNIIPLHKTGNKELISNYHPVSLFPICRKIFEKLIFDCIYECLYQNCLLNAKQSSFRPGDPCTYQRIAIVRNIFTAFDANPSLVVHGIFLDLSKTFDTIWHKGFMHKIKNNEID